MEGQKQVVLTVDDDASWYESYCDFFGEHRFNFAYARNGEEGVKFIRRLKPDYVVLDGNMPKKTGDEVLTDIVIDEFKPRIVLVSANTNPQLVCTFRDVTSRYGNAQYFDKCDTSLAKKLSITLK